MQYAGTYQLKFLPLDEGDFILRELAGCSYYTREDLDSVQSKIWITFSSRRGLTRRVGHFAWLVVEHDDMAFLNLAEWYGP